MEEFVLTSDRSVVSEMAMLRQHARVDTFGDAGSIRTIAV
jgi:hypothetical protein